MKTSPEDSLYAQSKWKAAVLDNRVFAVILVAMFTLILALPLFGTGEPDAKRIASAASAPASTPIVVADTGSQQR